MFKIDVNTHMGPYSIVIKNGIINNLTDYIDTTKPSVIITDSTVFNIYGKLVLNQFKNVHYIIVNPGEESKSIKQVELIYEDLAHNKISRQHQIIALGGGVIGDLTGFVASSYLRGVDFIQIPTTLLSQVDSSVGGKVGVNLSHGKNLVGSFKKPKCVVIDPKTLDSLDQKELDSAMSEVIKYACILDLELFKILENFIDKQTCFNHIDEIIYRCLNLKKQIVEEDEFEDNVRKYLNYGHTFAHPIEIISNYQINHGYAVGMGISIVNKLLSNLSESDLKRIDELLLKFDININSPYPLLDLYDILLNDKKNDSFNQSFVVVNEIGQAELLSIDNIKLKKILEDYDLK